MNRYPIDMQIKAIPVGAFDVNCWILVISDTQSLVVDPGADAETIAAHLEKMQVGVAGYLLTHGHMDHISALAALAERYPAPIHMNPVDATWAFQPVNQMPPYYPAPRCPPQELLCMDLCESKGLQLAGLSFDVLETPGHTPGGVCLYVPAEGFILTGDTLFAGSVGRTDFPGGNPEALTASLQKLAALPDSTVIYPGHGPGSTIGHEKQTNPFLQNLSSNRESC